MKNVLIHSLSKFHKDKPFGNERRNESFSVMLKQGKKAGFNVFLSRYEFFNRRNKQIKKAWVYKEGKWEKVYNKKIDLCFYHGKTQDINREATRIQKALNIPIINHMELEQVCDDKLLTYNIFPELLPKTFLVNDHYELHRVLHYVRTEMVVLKPRYGSYGRGVMILPKNKLKNGILKDTIVQEFIDSSKGIFDIHSVHDLRVIIIDGKIDHAYIRIPKQGSLISNATRGGKKIFIENSQITSNIKRIIKKVDRHFQSYGARVYSVDLAIDKDNKPKVIELNSKPNTLFYEEALQTRERFYKNIFKSLKQTMNNEIQAKVS